MKILSLNFFLMLTLSMGFYTKNAPADIESNFQWDPNCVGNIEVNSICEEAIPDSDNSSDPTNTDSHLTCRMGISNAETCCADPTTCLGGVALSTFQQVNTAVTMMGSGIGSMVTGLGKDMSGMCQTIQQLSAAGAGLSLSASLKCKAKISSCNSACDKEIKTNCQKYKTIKKSCPSTPPNFWLAQPIAQEIARLYKNKQKCDLQNAKVADWGDKMGQMLSTVLSAQMCKKQSGLIRDQEECKAIKGKWINGSCEDVEGLKVAQCEKSGGTWIKKTGKCRRKPTVTTDKNLSGPSPSNLLSPSPETAPSDTVNPASNNKKPDGSGGGGDPTNGRIPIPRSGTDLSTDAEENGSSQSSQGLSVASGGGGVVKIFQAQK